MKAAFPMLWRALAAHWRLKLGLSSLLTAFFCLPYFTLQSVQFAPVRTLPLATLDRAVPFVPEWAWVYQSIYLLLSIVPWLSASATHLWRYTRGFVLLASIGFAFFLVLPIHGPRPDVPASDPMFRLLVSYDTPLNSFPSLHVGLSVFTLLFGVRISHGLVPPLRRAAIAGLVVWVAAIAFATLATKQHYAVDLPAGALLALGCHAWSWRNAAEPRLIEVATNT